MVNKKYSSNHCHYHRSIIDAFLPTTDCLVQKLKICAEMTICLQNNQAVNRELCGKEGEQKIWRTNRFSS